jgi:hypothetical protein
MVDLPPEPASRSGDALAVALSLDVARLIRHGRADRSILWIQAAASAEEVLAQALEESAGLRDADAILHAARGTLLRFLAECGGQEDSTAA